ncbi:hypothetical protein [Aquimarina sp. RZ0]|uniref:hypothetical protein n=1 Tax=Aquimarina sp. RZ0 TaxID=2607730 RepID=UPI0011F3D9E0|nr:hypothetical protein [Aquimarina sp. RZ0]KAA1246549.1 hypothetical protein F0000_07245 [Aquimarina sp. RZ0]
MTISKTITRLCLGLITGLFIFSCEKEEFQTETLDASQSTIIPAPISFDELERKALGAKEWIETKTASDTVITWASVDGFYYERFGNTINGNPDTGVGETYSIWFEDANYIYVIKDADGENVALPKWDINTLRFSFVYNFTESRWIRSKEVRYTRYASSSDFVINIINIPSSHINFAWFVNSREFYDDYRYDIFVDNEKVVENLTYTSYRNHIVSGLEPDTNYDIKVIAKSQRSDAGLRIKNFSIKTDTRTLISKFEVRLVEVTQHSVTLGYNIPEVTNSPTVNEIERFEFRYLSGSTNIRLGYADGDNTEVTFEFIRNANGDITAIYSPETRSSWLGTVYGVSRVFDTPIPSTEEMRVHPSALVRTNDPDESTFTNSRSGNTINFQLL